MKRIIIQILAILITTPVFSQTLESIDWGAYQEMPKNTRFRKVIGSDDEGIYIIREDKYNKDKMWIEYVSRLTLTVDESNEIALPTYLGTQTHFFDMFYINKKFILITYSYDESTKQKKLFIQYLNRDGTLKNRPLLVATLPASNFPEDDFRVSLTDDKEILIFYQKSFKAYNQEKFTFLKYNSNLQKTFQEEISLPEKFNNRKFTVKQATISNKKKIIMLLKAEAINKRKSRRNTITKYEFVIVTYYPKKKEFRDAVVNLMKYKATDAIFTLNKDGNMVIAGFFEPKTNKLPGSFTGVYYKIYNPNTYKFLPSGGTKGYFKVLSKDMIAKLRTKRNGETPKQQFAYKLKSIELLDNGSFIVVSENQFVGERTITDPKTKTERKIKYFYYNDILTFGVNEKGIVSWVKIIPKNQFSIDDNGYFSSYKVIKIRNKIKLIYNDLPNNIKAKSPDKIKVLKNNLHLTAPRGIGIISSIFYDGSIITEPLFPDKDKNHTIVPALITPYDGQYFTIAIKKKEYKFGIFVIE